MNYSVNYLTLSPTHTDLCMEDLQDFDRVVFLNITHNYKPYNDKGPFMRMKSLRAFYVSNPHCRYYVEKGVLYTDDMDFFFDQMELGDDFEYLRNSKGRILVAVPPAYPTNDFVVPEGVVGILTGAFDGCNFETILFPSSLQVAPEAFLCNVKGLKTIFVSNEIKVNASYGVIELLDFEIKSNSGRTLDEKVIHSWQDCLCVYTKEYLEEINKQMIKDLDGRPLLSTFTRSFVFPNEKIKNDLQSIKTQDDLINVLENLWLYNEYESFVRAMVFLHIDPSLLYCNEEEPARKLIRFIWGSEENAMSFILSNLPNYIEQKSRDEFDFDVTQFAYNVEGLDVDAKFAFDDNSYFPYEHEQKYRFDNLELYAASHLIKTNPRYIFDYLGWTYLRKVLNKFAIDMLYRDFLKSHDLYITLNLMHIRHERMHFRSYYYILPEDFDYSQVENTALDYKDVLTIYGIYMSLCRHIKEQDGTYTIYESSFNKLKHHFELLKTGDMLTLGAHEMFLKRFNDEVSQMQDWIVTNVQIVEDPKVERESDELQDCENDVDLPF